VYRAGKNTFDKNSFGSLELKFSRIQFTPDLMPSDIIGTEIIEEDVSKGSKAFKFVKGLFLPI